jgi:hypothetical protein
MLAVVSKFYLIYQELAESSSTESTTSRFLETASRKIVDDLSMSY